MDRLGDTPKPAQNSRSAIDPHRLRFEATRSEHTTRLVAGLPLAAFVSIAGQINLPPQTLA